MPSFDMRTNALVGIILGVVLAGAMSKNVKAQNCGCGPSLCCSQFGFCGSGDQYCGPGCREGPCTGGGGGGTPAPGGNGVKVEDVVTEDFFNSIINQAGGDCKGKTFYTRDAFLNALGSYNQFGQTGSSDDSKREIAAFFAHVTHETERFCYIEEKDGASIDYCDKNDQRYRCVPGKQYFGRGPIQLTGNTNYGTAGEANQFDGLNNPEIVANDADISFKTALWFWMNNVRPSVDQGFGATIKAINPRECYGKRSDQVNDRIGYYTDYCAKFGVATGDNLGC